MGQSHIQLPYKLSGMYLIYLVLCRVSTGRDIINNRSIFLDLSYYPQYYRRVLKPLDVWHIVEETASSTTGTQQSPQAERSNPYPLVDKNGMPLTPGREGSICYKLVRCNVGFLKGAHKKTSREVKYISSAHLIKTEIFSIFRECGELVYCFVIKEHSGVVSSLNILAMIAAWSQGLLICVSSTSFQKSSICWPQQPLTEKVLKFNLILHDSTPKKCFFKTSK